MFLFPMVTSEDSHLDLMFPLTHELANPVYANPTDTYTRLGINPYFYSSAMFNS